MSVTTQPVSRNTPGVSYNTPVKKESQFFIKDNELVYRVQEGDTTERIAEKIEYFLLSLSGKKDFRGVTYDFKRKEDLLKVLKDYNDLGEIPYFKKGDLIYIPLIRDQIDFEGLMDQPKSIPDTLLEVTQKAPGILEKLNKIMPPVRQTIEEIAREQEIKELIKKIIDFIHGSAFDMSEAKIQEKIWRAIWRLGALKAGEAFKFLKDVFESDAKRVTPAVRWVIINTFSNIGDDNCVQYLIALFESKEKYVNESMLRDVIQALGYSKNPIALDFLKKMATVDKIYGYIRWEQEIAIDALGRFYQKTKDPEASKFLRQLLTYNDYQVRYWAANALGEVGGWEERFFLLEITKSGTEYKLVRDAAKKAIQKIEGRL